MLSNSLLLRRENQRERAAPSTQWLVQFGARFVFAGEFFDESVEFRHVFIADDEGAGSAEVFGRVERRGFVS